MERHLNICNLFLLLIISGCNHTLEKVKISSPDQRLQFHLETKDNLYYSIDWKGQLLIPKSALGFVLSDGTNWQEGMKIQHITRNKVHQEWEPVYGEQRTYPDHYNEALIELSKNSNAKIALRVRAYNEGVAFRYEIESQKDLQVDQELTEFSYPSNVHVWASSHAQGEIKKQRLAELDFIAERPLLAEHSDSIFTAIGEAALVDFARMKFERHPTKENSLVASLEKGTEDQYPITIPANGYQTPWRYIMAGKNAAQILQNNFLLLNLNEENQVLDTEFIRPGKVIREVTLTTQGGMACVDFAEKYNLQFVEFDAGWYGHEYEDASDATTVTVDPNRSTGPLDLMHIIDYAEERGIGIILYVNRRALEKQLDEVLPLLKSWGIDGLKYGFVQVGSQKWTTWLHEAVRKAADYELMVDVHDEYRPTGYSRTYPNLMTQEGIRGDEESAPNDGVINTLFTRMIAGAGDQTNCYFADRVTEKMGSRASQMAKTICIYSPWQFLFWYDRPIASPSSTGGAGGAKNTIQEIEDLQFFAAVPTVWDQTQVIEGYPGKYVSIARRSGAQWFLGSLAGTEAYNLSLKLDFLDDGKPYTAKIFSDEQSLNSRTNVLIREIEVDRQTIFNQSIRKQNGLAIIFTPVEID